MTKVKVIPEGRPDIYIPSIDSLISFINETQTDQIHNFLPLGNMFIGADWSKESVITRIVNAERVAVLLQEAKSNNRGHALALVIEDRLELFDIKIDENDLNLVEIL